MCLSNDGLHLCAVRLWSKPWSCWLWRVRSKRKPTGSKRFTSPIRLVSFWENASSLVKSLQNATSTPPPYISPQSQFKEVNDADLKAMDAEISARGAEVQSLTQSCRELDAGAVLERLVGLP